MLGGVLAAGLAVLAIWPLASEAPWEESSSAQTSMATPTRAHPTETRCERLEERLSRASEPRAAAILAQQFEQEGCLGSTEPQVPSLRWIYVPADDAANAQNYPGSLAPPCADFTFTHYRTAYPNSEAFTDQFGTWVAVQCLE
jgi:hypothetical protein